VAEARGRSARRRSQAVAETLRRSAETLEHGATARGSTPAQAQRRTARRELTLLSPGGLASVFFVCAFSVWWWPRSAAARRVAMAAAVFYLLASIYVVPAAVASALLMRGTVTFDRPDVGGRGTAIVLLGGGSERVQGHHEFMSLMFPTEAARVLEAARVFKLLSADWIISSGGAGSSGDSPNSIVMGDTLARLGVPASRIVFESSSLTTHDEAILIAPILKSLGVQHTVLVTSAVHMRRSLSTFRAAGVPAIPAPAVDPGVYATAGERWRPSLRGLRFSAEVAHECVGLVYYRARGWLAR
jgi:uncharacterized SAM-binding protein YcdF (DUF218 family)